MTVLALTFASARAEARRPEIQITGRVNGDQQDLRTRMEGDLGNAKTIERYVAEQAKAALDAVEVFQFKLDAPQRIATIEVILEQGGAGGRDWPAEEVTLTLAIEAPDWIKKRTLGKVLDRGEHETELLTKVTTIPNAIRRWLETDSGLYTEFFRVPFSANIALSGKAVKTDLPYSEIKASVDDFFEIYTGGAPHPFRACDMNWVSGWLVEAFTCSCRDLLRRRCWPSQAPPASAPKRLYYRGRSQ
ncbi:hypothetical protein [Sorangium sp. So ce861]|uniref:hypothetical protein n=1 Tax=Sorangium sp. So ce861 TaxID=3133323 RepID=UPI003F62CA81